MASREVVWTEHLNSWTVGFGNSCFVSIEVVVWQNGSGLRKISAEAFSLYQGID